MQPNYLLVVWRFPPGNASTKDSKLCVPGSRQVCQSFQFCGMFPAAGTILHSPGCKRCHSVAGVLIFPPGRPALSLALFYQIWPCPCKCPNGHKNGICVCFYPKSAISCRDCPIQSPQSLCTSPTKSYKFVSANPCKTGTGRINKYYYIGYVGGSFWNFIRFRDSRKRCKTSPSSSLTLDATSPGRRGFGIPSRFPAKPNQFHRKRNLFAKGSPARGAGERQRD